MNTLLPGATVSDCCCDVPIVEPTLAPSGATPPAEFDEEIDGPIKIKLQSSAVELTDGDGIELTDAERGALLDRLQNRQLRSAAEAVAVSTIVDKPPSPEYPRKLRDWFAGIALQGMLTSAPMCDRTAIDTELWAARAYEWSEAMMDARKPKEQP